MGKEILIGGKIEFLTEDEVCIKFKPMIIKEVKSWSKYYDYDDMFQISYIGLLKAYRKYDIKFGYSFSTVAISYIRYEMLRETRTERRRKKKGKVMFLSLNKVIGFSNNIPVEIVDISKDKENIIDKVENKIFLTKIINSLPKEEKRIIKLIYMEDKTQVQVAKELDITQVQVSRKLKRIFKNIREQLGA